ncbi:MAG TPA: MaoC family dehydratase [Pedomonas sp.]|uniref:MaoC family dehydratase n=1 Tax=Pedomonas sp. TaxID=2976421 RepID=UPI002F3E4172
MTISADEFKALEGKHLGVSEWFLVDQARINQFAEVTRDFQFIHVNEERARATPLGGTIAHGQLTLSLVPTLAEEVMPVVDGITMGFNYGYDRVRFLSPVRSGKRVRGSFSLKTVDLSKPGRIAFCMEVTIEIEGEDKPALVADWLGLTMF